jgi:hypothetical protein
LEPHSELTVSLKREGSNALLSIRADGWVMGDERDMLLFALSRLCGGAFSVQEGEARLAFPLVGTA